MFQIIMETFDILSQIKTTGGGQVRPHPVSQWPRPPSQR